VILVTLREPVVLPPAIPECDADGKPLDWSYDQAAGLRFARWRADHGHFDDDLVGDAPEPLPPIVRRLET